MIVGVAEIDGTREVDPVRASAAAGSTPEQRGRQHRRQRGRWLRSGAVLRDVIPADVGPLTTPAFEDPETWRLVVDCGFPSEPAFATPPAPELFASPGARASEEKTC